MEIKVNIGEVENLLKICYPSDPADYDAAFDERIIKIANLLCFDLIWSGFGKNHTRDMIFQKNRDFTNIEKVIEDLEKEDKLYSKKLKEFMESPEPEKDAK